MGTDQPRHTGRAASEQEGETGMHDQQALAEIELYGELVIAASAAEGPLSNEQIDAILGVRHPVG